MQRYPAESDRQWLEHLAKRVAEVCVAGNSWTSVFLSTRRRQLTEEFLWHEKKMKYIVYGGYAAARRVRVRIWSKQSNLPGELPGIVYLSATNSIGDSFIADDLWRALREAGIPGNMLGDVVIGNGGVGIYVQKEITVMMNGDLLQAGKYLLRMLAEAPLAPDEKTLEKGKPIKGTVATPRLDAVLGLAFGLSRARAVDSIHNGQVQINWQNIADPAKRLKEKDIIIFRGTALILQRIAGQTKKGRHHIYLQKMNNNATKNIMNK